MKSDNGPTAKELFWGAVICKIFDATRSTFCEIESFVCFPRVAFRPCALFSDLRMLL